ncbi:ferric reductase-like transmembrane domain-containing protein [Pseudaestuariivita sp.]|uniref:ferric reductase-like transmembrane domain-containing protein n=1 Tax=Pseudaestuariivita sp. TaxID=2211669 RepID=UPI0040587676
MRNAAIWTAIAVAVGAPLALSALSPLLAWRDPIYIIAGFSGVLALGLLLIQPLAIAGALPGLKPPSARKVHRLIGLALVLAVAVHIAGLWITSPPDVIDVLTFASPTPFGVWGALAMWGVIFAAALAAFRRRLRLAPRTWRVLHVAFALLAAGGTVAHALLIEGTMEVWSKWALSLAVLVAAGWAAVTALRR